MTILIAAAPVAAAACGDAPTSAATSDPAPAVGPAPTATTKPSVPESPDASRDAHDPHDAPAGPDADDPAVIAKASCTGALPSNGARAAALPVYAGTCPALAASPSSTTITTSGAARTFIVIRPTAIAPGEKLPVIFLWHWLGGSPEDMGSRLEVQTAVDARRFIGVVPAPKGDAIFRWPIEGSQSQARVEEEAIFFDDMLACVGAVLPVNKECVSSMGVSAGALWTAQLAGVRSQRLASMVSLSGGVGGVVRPWSAATHRLPALVLWGGADDLYPANIPIVNFQNASKGLIGALAKDSHYVMECTHNCGHAVPPFDVPAAPGLMFDPVWRFVLDHPYWLAASKSPYAGKALPPAYPSWCGQGPGSATARAPSAACP
jgi:predicted esterase